MKTLLIAICSYFLFGAISTPALVVDMDVSDNVNNIVSVSATPSEYALILKICGTVDGGLSSHNVPTDDWANTPTWIEIIDENDGSPTVLSIAYTTTGASPGAGQVTQTFSEVSAANALTIIEITNVQLRDPIVASNSGNTESATLSITVSGTLGPNDVMVSGIISRQDTDGLTPTGNNTVANGGGEIDDEVIGGSFSSSGQTQFNTVDLVASWSDVNGSTVKGTGGAVHIRGLNNIMLLGSLKPKVRILYHKGFGD